MAQAVAEGVLVFLLAYATAFGETITIAHFPYYSFKVCGRSTHTAGWLRPASGCIITQPSCQPQRQTDTIAGVRWSRQG
jgi:cycloeucalenol cycloisomerase